MKNGKVLASGTLEEISEKTGKRIGLLRQFNVPHYLEKAGKNALKLLKTR